MTKCVSLCILKTSMLSIVMFFNHKHHTWILRPSAKSPKHRSALDAEKASNRRLWPSLTATASLRLTFNMGRSWPASLDFCQRVTCLNSITFLFCPKSSLHSPESGVCPRLFYNLFNYICVPSICKITDTEQVFGKKIHHEQTNNSCHMYKRR